MSVKQYRKKPVAVEAWQLSVSNMADVIEWIENNGGEAGYHSEPPMRAVTGIYIDTLEGDMKANYGDYIIKGVKGEFYPCKPDIFEATYEPVEEPTHE